MITRFFLGIVWLCCLHGQTVNIADTLGKGKRSVFVSSSAIGPKDFTTISYSFSQLAFGINERADVYVGASETILFGQKQTAIIGGANVTLFRPGPVSVSTFNVVGTALNRRQDAANATLFSAMVASWTLDQKQPNRPTPYVGYSVFLPLGKRTDKLFTPPTAVHSFPIGVMIPRGKWSFFAEYGMGKKQKNFSVGAGYVF